MAIVHGNVYLCSDLVVISFAYDHDSFEATSRYPRNVLFLFFFDDFFLLGYHLSVRPFVSKCLYFKYIFLGKKKMFVNRTFIYT